MSTVHRAFLSYSSNERAVVNKVAKYFTASRVVVDSMNFNDSKLTVDEILTHLKSTSVIAVFLSKGSVESNWVQFELQQALHRLGSDSIDLVIYIIDDLTINKVPDWLKAYTIHYTSSEVRIAETIEDILEKLDQRDGYIRDFFIGRYQELDNLLRGISPISAPAPAVIFLGGVDGIGKKTLLRKVIHDSLGQVLKTNRVKITMPDEGGFIEFFEMLTEYDSLDSFRKAQEQLNDFRSSNEDERILKTVRKIELFNQERLLVTMVGRFGLVADEGDLQPWLRNLVFQLPMGRFPRLAICSSRMVRGEFRESYPNVVFQPVRNLFEEHARDLLTLWFNLLQLNATEQNIRDVIAITGGRPYAIRRAAQLANEHGLDMVLERHQLRRLLSLGYESTIQQIKSQLDKAITALLLHFERLSLSDLVLAANKAINDIADSIANLMANMIVENEADYYFVAPHLIDILSRENWLSDYDVLCKNASSALIEKIKQFEPDEYISVASLNAAVIGAIHRNELLPSQLVNLVKPAQLLRVGKHLYDHGRYTRSSEILGKALEIHQELTIDAIIEGLRLRAMCLARLYHEQPAQQSEFHKIVERLNDIQTTKAKQSRCFVLGFQARISGHLEKAHKHYRQAIRDYRGDRNFHVLNEYSKVLLRLHEYDDALRYARLALEIAPTNPYVLEVVITALIERHKRLSEDNGDEINKLLGDLEVASARMDTCHYQCCSSRYQLKIGNVHEALELADAAVKFIKDKPGNIDSDMTFQAHFTRAQCLFKSKRYKDMETNLYELEKKISEQRDFRRFSTSVLQLRIQQLMRLNDFDRARATINRAIGVSYIDRNRLKEELDREEAYASKLN